MIAHYSAASDIMAFIVTYYGCARGPKKVNRKFEQKKCEQRRVNMQCACEWVKESRWD